MIKSIILNNFFSFKEQQIVFPEGECLLLGINGSGKSNLLKALTLLTEGISGTGFKKLILDSWGGFDQIAYLGDKGDAISLRYELDINILREFGFDFAQASVYYELTIHRKAGYSNHYLTEKLYRSTPEHQTPFYYFNFSNGSGYVYEVKPKSKGGLVKYENFDPQESVLRSLNDPDRYRALSAVRTAFESVAVYTYFDTTQQSKIRKSMLSTSESKLLSDGSNLPQLLNTIKIEDKPSINVIKEELHEVNSYYKDFDFHFIGGNMELMLEETGLNRSVPVTHISDGTLRFLCLMAILYNSKRGKLVCIDEPEVGLHPDMILSVAKAIEYAGKKSQIIVATHNEHLIDQFQLEQLRVFEKQTGNSTTVRQYNEDNFAGWYEQFNPGKMWRQGDLGGNRY